MAAVKRAFENQTILITGASSGLGAEFARQLVKGGASVALVARRLEMLEGLKESLSGFGPKIAIAAADVGQRDEIQSAIGRLAEQLQISAFDRVLLNAGVGRTFRATSFDARMLDEMTRVNYIGAAHCIEAVLPGMIAARRGHIVGISSLSARRGLPLGYAYGASKAALTVMLEGLRVELKPLGVDVTVIHPGFIKTPMTENQTTTQVGLLEADDAVGRMLAAIAARRLQFNFPGKTTFLTEAIRRLPAGISDRLVARFVLRDIERAEAGGHH